MFRQNLISLISLSHRTNTLALRSRSEVLESLPRRPRRNPNALYTEFLCSATASEARDAHSPPLSAPPFMQGHAGSAPVACMDPRLGMTVSVACADILPPWLAQIMNARTSEIIMPDKLRTTRDQFLLQKRSAEPLESATKNMIDSNTARHYLTQLDHDNYHYRKKECLTRALQAISLETQTGKINRN